MHFRTLLTSTLLCSALIGCTSSSDDIGDDDVTIPPDVVEPCPEIFAQHLLPEYHLDIAPNEWAALQDEFLHRVEREAAGLPTEPWHPIGFRYGDNGESVPNVLLRLKGSSSWLQTIRYDENPRMQFVIAFNEVNPDQRWKGVRKLELDMPRTDETFLRQRLALYALRTSGIPAQCANNARVVINGDYYGLYTNLERMDKEFLQIRFPGADDGDLWKGGRIIKTNEDTFSWDRVDALWHDVTTPAELDVLVDMDASIDEWAAEAMIGDADGYYNGRANFYLYDHPTRGFIWIPQDLDTVFADDYLSEDASPIWPACMFRWEGDWIHFLMVMNDPVWQEKYVTALAAARARFKVDVLQERVDLWSRQIANSAANDPHPPFTTADTERVTGQTRAFIAERAEYIDGWLACRRGGGTDGDGDGFAHCFECDDTDPAVKPGAVETCNGVDDNCNGSIDDLAGDAVCP